VEPKKTLLYDEHIKLGGKMANFAGWLMPLWYSSGQSAEHHATRNACGIFDICHMGEFRIKGPGSLDYLSWMLTNDIHRIVDGQAMYNFMLNDNGGVIDDCIVYRFDSENWMLVVNAGDIDGDFKWLQEHKNTGVSLENISDEIVKIDLQGPHAPKLIKNWIDEETMQSLKFFRFIPECSFDGIKVLVSRTGYTGEIGFELYADKAHGIDLWNMLLKAGQSFGIQPCGLGARDTLRTEAGLPLYGHELQSNRVALGHPWEFAISMESDFFGKDQLLKRQEQGLDYFVYPFMMEGKRKAMPGWEVVYENDRIGTVLSGVISPTLNNSPIGFIGVDRSLEEGCVLVFRQEGRPVSLKGTVSKMPFVPPTSRKKMSAFL
jgi:aminomethyltransferase